MGRDVSRDKGGDQAAWRDLVARLELPSTVDPADAPWPDRENLRSTVAAPDSQVPADADQQATTPPAAEPSATQPPPAAPRDTNRGHVIRPASQARTPEPDHQAGWRGASASASVPGQPDSASAGAEADDDQPTSPDMLNFLDYLDEDYEDPKDPNNRYIPPPVPRQPKLDPIAKGAWTALFGGPAYLLIATMFSWQVPGWGELLAIAAFVTGFVVLVSRLGDGPSRRDGPDQGAVV